MREARDDDLFIIEPPPAERDRDRMSKSTRVRANYEITELHFQLMRTTSPAEEKK